MTALRDRMVEDQLVRRGIADPRVLAAFRRVPREAFVPAALVAQAYEDHPLAIGEGQTISQPYVVALTVAELHLEGHERVLEIGTGSGYAAAILGQLAAEVVTIERLEGLATSARARLARLGIANVRVELGDGTLGWPAAAPFDAICVAAGAPHPPRALLAQLAIRGRLVIPAGPLDGQMLLRITREAADRYVETSLGPVRFVPLVGTDGWPG